MTRRRPALLLLPLLLAGCGKAAGLRPPPGGTLPVDHWSDRATKPKGWDAHSTNSSASRDRCSAHCVAAWR